MEILPAVSKRIKKERKSTTITFWLDFREPLCIRRPPSTFQVPQVVSPLRYMVDVYMISGGEITKGSLDLPE